MTNDFAKFKAEVAKGIKIGDSSVELKLLIPLKDALPHLVFLSNNQCEEVFVHLGDPQASFDFEDQERDPMYNTWNGGRRVTTDASGVVTRIEGSGEEEKDENQAELFEQNGDPQELTGDDSETHDGDGQPVVPPTDGEGSDPNDPYGDNDGIPTRINQGGDVQSEPKEMDFSSEGSEGDQAPSADPQQDQPAGEKDSAPAEINKEDLELFILNQRPIFDDIKFADGPADFPALLQQRKVEGKTWLEISKEMNIPSSQISSKFNAYKKRVAKMMQDGVAV